MSGQQLNIRCFDFDNAWNVLQAGMGLLSLENMNYWIGWPLDDITIIHHLTNTMMWSPMIFVKSKAE